jgi:4-hydroxy-3-polyprenylbenzoate decarboxylase
VEGLASFNYSVNDLGARVASGSFRTDGMVIAPCTVKTLSGIAHSYNQNLIIRAADVALKEKRRLVLVVRETPLHLGHLKIMAEAAELGAMILPPAPAFYHRPKTIDDLVDHTVGRILDLLDIEHDLCRRWDGAEEENREGPRESKRLIGILDRD